MRAKKVLSILFALALVLSSLPASAIAESIEDAGKYSVVVTYLPMKRFTPLLNKL